MKKLLAALLLFPTLAIAQVQQPAIQPYGAITPGHLGTFHSRTQLEDGGAAPSQLTGGPGLVAIDDQNTVFLPTLSGLTLTITGPGTGTLTASGGGGTPGGTSGQTQYNNAGAFGGYTPSGDVTVNTSTGVETVTKTNGVAFAASATTDTTSATNITAGSLAYARMAALSANQVLGALTGTTPSGLSVPSCPSSSNALTWTSGVGFGCNTIAGSGTVTSSTGGQIPWFSTTGTAVIGNANLNISSGALTIGVAGTTAGSVGLSGSGSGVVSIIPQAAAGTYNFELPITAGTAGQPLLSGGGGSSAPMTWAGVSGNTTTFASTSGTLTNGHVAKFDASGNVVDGGAAGSGPAGAFQIVPRTGAWYTNTNYGASGGLAASRLYTFPIDLGATAPVNLGWFLSATSPGSITHWQMGIFSDSNGPATLVTGCDTGSIAIPATTSSSARTASISCSSWPGAGRYWLVMWVDAGSISTEMLVVTAYSTLAFVGQTGPASTGAGQTGLFATTPGSYGTLTGTPFAAGTTGVSNSPVLWVGY